MENKQYTVKEFNKRINGLLTQSMRSAHQSMNT